MPQLREMLCLLLNLTDETISACSQRIKIPMGGRAESLNASAAAAILMWELIRNK